MIFWRTPRETGRIRPRARETEISLRNAKLGSESMKTYRTYLALIWASCMVMLPGAYGQTTGPLKLIQSIPLPNVEGYFDHMAVDIKGQRLFVPGEHQRTIEVIDLKAGKVIHTITGFGGDPRKTIYLPETNEIWVDDGDATCKAFSGDTYELVKNIPLTGHELD